MESNRETIMVIKDSIFESVMMDNDLVQTLRSLHYNDGFKKEDIITAYMEMKEEANE